MFPAALFFCVGAEPSDGAIDLALAKAAFKEAKSLADADGGRLWGVSLDGPILIIDPNTRQVVANQADKEGKLNPSGGVFVGRYPTDQTFANTAMRWGGVFWTMLLWPLPEDPGERARLLMHESFHRVQPDLKWPDKTLDCHHLEFTEARILLQLEYRAVGKALQAQGDDRNAHLRAALAFRAERYRLYPDAEKSERSLELLESLAEYTGFKLSQTKPADQVKVMIKRLKDREGAEAYMRSFPYDAGPAYCMILDDAAPGWRKTVLQKWEFVPILAAKLGKDPAQPTVAELAKKYDGDRLRLAEEKRAKERQVLIDSYRAKLVEGPLLVIDLVKPQLQFNPQKVVSLGDEGTVYLTMTAIDQWGTLTVESGGGLMKNWALLRVSAPTKVEGDRIEGEGWTLKLNPGWTVAPGKRAGDLTLVRS